MIVTILTITIIHPLNIMVAKFKNNNKSRCHYNSLKLNKDFMKIFQM